MSEKVEVTPMPLASVHPEPRPFSQAVPEHTTGSVVVVERARVKVTRQSTPVYPKGNAIALAYQLKVPTQEPVFAIFNLYSMIRDLVFSFDRGHEESWFEAYPQAVILAKGEEYPSRAELRAQYRKYATRLAHYAYYYRVAHTMRSAALINLLTLSRFQGKTRRKDVATLVRWSFINRNTGDFAIYPQPIGALNSMIAAAKPASGTTAAGVSMLALPLFDVSVYGNLGNHAGSLKDGIVDITPDTMNGAAGSYGYENSDEVVKFYENAAAIVSDYYDSKSFDIINPSTLVINTEEEGKRGKSAYISLQSDGRKRFANSNPEHATSITENAWENYNFWANVLAQQFREMRDPAHDIFKLFVQLKFVEENTPTAEQVMNAVHNSQFYDITSLRNAMQYMEMGKANTATIVRQCLPLANRFGNIARHGKSVAVDTRAIFDPDVFEDNFERFRFFEDTATEWIHQAKLWPGLTPRMFPDSDSESSENQAALVVNATSSDGSIAPVAEGFTNAGKYASYYDYATHQTLDPAKSIVEMSAIDESTAKAMVDNREGFICSEDPSQLFVKVSKFLDTSDPYQCGFFLLNSVPDSALSELEVFLNDVQSFLNPQSDIKQTQVQAPSKFVLATSLLDGVPVSLADPRVTGVSVPSVQPTATFLNNMGWYSMLFVGDMASLLPQARSLLNSFALPVEQSQAARSASPAQLSAVDAVQRKVKELKEIAALEILETAESPASALTAENKVAIAESVAKAAQPANNVKQTLFSKVNNLFSRPEDGAPDFYLATQRSGTQYDGKRFRLTLDSWTPASDSGDSAVRMCIKGSLQFLGKQGEEDGSPIQVAFYSRDQFNNFGSTEIGPQLTNKQLIQLQAVNAADGSPEVNATWATVANWDKVVNGKNGSVYATFYTALLDAEGKPQLTQPGGKLQYDANGFKLAVQVPIASVAEQASSVLPSLQQIVEGDDPTTALAAQSSPSDTEVDEIFAAIGVNAKLALWRYATNVVRDPKQTKRAVAFYKQDTAYVLNPSAVIASLLASTLDVNEGVELFMFNPQYGPVAIITPPIPMDADYGFQPNIALDSDKPGAGGSPESLFIKMGIFQQDGSFKSRANQRGSFQDTQWASHLWRWAVKGFAFQQAKLVNGRPIVQGGNPVRFNDEIAQRWPLTMFAQIVVTFAGSGDIDFFDNVVGKSDQIDAPKVTTTAPTTVNGLIFVPARLTSKPLAAKLENTTGPDRTKESYASKQQNDTYAVSSEPTPSYEKGGARDRGTGHPGTVKRNKGKKGKKLGNKPAGQTFQKESDALSTKEITAKEGGPLDVSDNAEDKAVERKFKKPSFGTPLQLG